MFLQFIKINYNNFFRASLEEILGTVGTLKIH